MDLRFEDFPCPKCSEPMRQGSVTTGGIMSMINKHCDGCLINITLVVVTGGDEYELTAKKVEKKLKEPMPDWAEKLDWKPSEIDGHFYALHEGSIMCAPMLKDLTMEVENMGEVEDRAFSEEEEQGFVDIVVGLFGDIALTQWPVRIFKNIGRELSHAEWLMNVTFELEQIAGVNTSDAQGIIEAQPFIIIQAWAKDSHVKETAERVDKASKGN